MRQTLPPPTTPLLSVLRALDSADKRKAFATEAKTSVAYLYQLATCKRSSCRAQLSMNIAKATVEMNKLYGTAILTMEDLATMCALTDKPVGKKRLPKQVS